MKSKLMFLSKTVALFLLAGLIVAVIALAFPTGSAAAAVSVQEEQLAPGAAKTPDPARLEKAYQREQELVKIQAERLDRLDDRAVKFAERIAGLKEKGKDVTALEQALADFKAKLADARSQHEAAVKILDTHAGFDASGKVSDVTQAAATVKDAGKLLRGVRQDLRPALREIVRVVRQYLRDNR